MTHRASFSSQKIVHMDLKNCCQNLFSVLLQPKSCSIFYFIFNEKATYHKSNIKIKMQSFFNSSTVMPVRKFDSFFARSSNSILVPASVLNYYLYLTTLHQTSSQSASQWLLTGKCRFLNQ